MSFADLQTHMYCFDKERCELLLVAQGAITAGITSSVFADINSRSLRRTSFTKHARHVQKYKNQQFIKQEGNTDIN